MNIKAFIAFTSLGVSFVFGGGQHTFYGEIIWTAANFCPKGFADAQGQILPLSQNTALFSLLGTTYGGDGKSNFALPNLLGRFALGQGQGPGLSPMELGEQVGSETVVLTTSQIPYHQHAVSNISNQSRQIAKPKVAVCNTSAEERQPVNNYLAKTSTASYDSVKAASTDTLWAVRTSIQVLPAPAGGDQPTPVRSPYVGLKACVALQGIFPPRP